MCLKNFSKASRPPAEAPSAAIRKLPEGAERGGTPIRGARSLNEPSPLFGGGASDSGFFCIITARVALDGGVLLPATIPRCLA